MLCVVGESSRCSGRLVAHLLRQEAVSHLLKVKLSLALARAWVNIAIARDLEADKLINPSGYCALEALLYREQLQARQEAFMVVVIGNGEVVDQTRTRKNDLLRLRVRMQGSLQNCMKPQLLRNLVFKALSCRTPQSRSPAHSKGRYHSMLHFNSRSERKENADGRYFGSSHQRLVKMSSGSLTVAAEYPACLTFIESAIIVELVGIVDRLLTD
eukprot:154959-Pleurochrysis_carterae.AAC.1